MSKVMVFAPHPDDDVFGCGGSIAKHTKNGDLVLVTYMTSGDAGSLKYNKAELAALREREAGDAAYTLGVSRDNLIFLRNPDGYLEYSQKNLVSVIELIRQCQPHIVYLPHKDDGHKDHQKTYEIVAESIMRAAGPWFQECRGQPWSVTTALCYEFWTPLQEVSFTEDISDFIDMKVTALRQHESQIADIPYGEAAESLARYRGMQTGKGKYCECFKVLRAGNLF